MNVKRAWKHYILLEYIGILNFENSKKVLWYRILF